MKKYLITSHAYHTDNKEEFVQKLESQFLKHKPDYALFRDEQTDAYFSLAQEFVSLCKKYGVKSFLHKDKALAKELGAFGIHLKSSQFGELIDAVVMCENVIISTHSEDEVLVAQEMGAYAVTYSPIFTTPDKGEPKGVDELARLCQKVGVRVFALGGIVTSEQIELVATAKAYGFASIRYYALCELIN